MNQFNLELPIFTYTINTDGISRQKMEETIAGVHKQLEVTNLQYLIIPSYSLPTKMECIWSGFKQIDKMLEYDKIAAIKNTINSLVLINDEITDSNISDIIQLIRNIKLEHIEKNMNGN